MTLFHFIFPLFAQSVDFGAGLVWILLLQTFTEIPPSATVVARSPGSIVRMKWSILAALQVVTFVDILRCL